MPLVTRIIQAAVPLPEYAAAAKDHALAGDSAIEITHATSLMQLTRVVDQLSQLSTVAAEMFADIAAISDATSNRLHGLQARVQKVKSLLPQMESRIQETAVTNELPTERTEWRTTNSMSLNAFTKATANPTVTSVYYQTCEAPPDLNSLNGFRDDGKPCMRFYSYPEFFVEQWKILMIKEEEAIRKHRKAEKKQNKKDRRKKLTKVRAVDVKRYNSTGELITSTSVDENAPVNQSQSYLSSVKITTEVARENSSNPAESPSPMSPWTEIPSPLAYQGSSQQLAQAQSVPQTKIASLASGAPGGPPPPPSPPAALAPPPPPPPPLKVITGSDAVARPKQAGGVPPPRAPGRNDLLSSIRDGEFKLKKVDERLLTPKSPDAAAGNDVAHILMRRAALEMSDSEDDSGSDDDEWD